VFVEVVILAVSIFTHCAGKLMSVCLCVCGGGDSNSVNFYTGCRKTNCVCLGVCGGGDRGSIKYSVQEN
jgi:hypothetical protein